MARTFAAPTKLDLAGRKLAPLVTCAPRKDACVMCIDPRFTTWPFTKVEREAAVTARVSCAKRKLKCAALELMTLMLVKRVFVMLMLFTNTRLQRNHG